MTEAIAKPWRRIQGGTTIVGGKGMFVCQTRISNFTADDSEAQANAELIVRAVNSHDDLQATISRLTAENERLRKALQETSTALGNLLDVCGPTVSPPGGLFDQAKNTRDKARAALATPAVTDADGARG